MAKRKSRNKNGQGGQPGNSRHLTIPQALDLAVQHHSNGRLAEAEDLYQEILQIEPNQPDALHLLGVIAHQVGRGDIAIEYISRSIVGKPGNVTAHNNLGLALHGVGRDDEALKSFLKAIELDPLHADTHDNMGITLRSLWRVEDAIDCHRRALEINPQHPLAHYNLGNALYSCGRSQEAVESYRTAIHSRPDFAEAHKNMAAALKDLDAMDDALSSYRNALAITPNDTEVHTNMGTIFQDLGQLEQAVVSYRLANTLISQPKLLECLFALGQYDDFDAQRQELIERQGTNIRGAAISAFAAQQLDQDDPFPFCPSPLDFVQVFDMDDGAPGTGGFIADLIDELTAQPAVWEPKGIATTKGFQTLNSLFDAPEGNIAKLQKLFTDRIEDYRKKYDSLESRFIQSWPEQSTLKGWFVRLQQGGYQDAHIHPDGWLSGVIYLKMPDTETTEEGAIEFGLWGFEYPILKEHPTKLIKPKVGQIVLFPSSLFHRTIPFSSEDERLVVAFDLLPERR